MLFKINFAKDVCSLQLISHMAESLNQFCGYFFLFSVFSGGAKKVRPFTNGMSFNKQRINKLNGTASVDKSNLIPELFKMPKQQFREAAGAGWGRGNIGAKTHRAMCCFVDLLLNKYPIHEYSSTLTECREPRLKMGLFPCFSLLSAAHIQILKSSPTLEKNCI